MNKELSGFEGLYFIDEAGIVTNKAGEVIKTHIAGGSDGKSYEYVNLYKEGKCYIFTVHRLVAISFLDQNDFKFVDESDYISYKYGVKKLEINHKNKNKLDNRVENLEWCTRRYNMNYKGEN